MTKTHFFTVILPLFLLASCAFPTHTTFHTGRTLPQGQMALNFGYNPWTSGFIAPTVGSENRYSDVSVLRNNLLQYKSKLPKEMLGLEGGFRIGIIRRLEYQFHGSILSTLRNSVRYQFLGDAESRWAASIGLGYLYNKWKSQRIQDVYLPLSFSYHPSRKVALYYSLLMIDRKYQNWFMVGDEYSETMLQDLYYTFYQSGTTGKLLPLHQIGLQANLSSDVALSFEYGFAYSKFMESTQASVGVTYVFNYAKRKK
jgi:hypothetical protein